MGKSVTNVAAFDPFTQVLAPDERLRLKDGQLIVEKSNVRSESSAWTRFWTRGQYSQSAILKEMSKLYKTAKKEQKEDHNSHINNTFLENYRTLVGRAITQNVECSKLNSLSRFFNAKSAINVDKAYSQIELIDKDLAEAEAEEQKLKAAEEAKAKVDEKLENSGIKLLINYKSKNETLSEARIAELETLFEAESTPWWDDQELEGTDNIYDGFDYPIVAVETVLEPLGRKVKPGNTTEQLTAVLKALGLYEVQGHFDNKINGPLHLELYLLQNKEALAQKLDTLDFIENK